MMPPGCPMSVFTFLGYDDVLGYEVTVGTRTRKVGANVANRRSRVHWIIIVSGRFPKILNMQRHHVIIVPNNCDGDKYVLERSTESRQRWKATSVSAEIHS